MANEWALLVYKLPSLPSRLRLSVWRRLQALGCIYLQDGVCVLPRRDDLFENLQYVAVQISEGGGVFHLLTSKGSAEESEKLIERFRILADERLRTALTRLRELELKLSDIGQISDFERAEDELKKERVAFLKARRLNYFGSDLEVEVEAALDRVRSELDRLARGAK